MGKTCELRDSCSVQRFPRQSPYDLGLVCLKRSIKKSEEDDLWDGLAQCLLLKCRRLICTRAWNTIKYGITDCYELTCQSPLLATLIFSFAGHKFVTEGVAGFRRLVVNGELTSCMFVAVALLAGSASIWNIQASTGKMGGIWPCTSWNAWSNRNADWGTATSRHSSGIGIKNSSPRRKDRLLRWRAKYGNSTWRLTYSRK